MVRVFFRRWYRRSMPAALAALAAALIAGVPGRAHAPAPEACFAPIADEKIVADSGEKPDAVQRVLVDYLSRRYAVDTDAAALVVSAAHRAAEEVGLDPLLVLAVISVESSFNPIAESVMGAKGLMQIIPKFHRARLSEVGGDEAVLDPEANIQVGTRILQEYVYRRGTLEAGLQYYNGASSDGSAQYATKVMAERQRLEQVVRSALRQRAAAIAALSRGG